MKNFTKLFLTIALVSVSIVCKSQVFTATEFINLAYKSQSDLKNVIEDKGYHFSRTDNSDMSENDIFTASNNMSVSVIYPTFEDGQSLLSWEFTNSDGLFNNLNSEILAAGFKKTETENRNGSRYTVYTYQRPGMTVTLSRDKMDNPNGIYRLSVRYASLGAVAVTSVNR